jgi:hypothetical protein
MSATLHTLPELWLDQRFDVAFGPVLDKITLLPTGYLFTGGPLRLHVTHQRTGVRHTLTEADATFTDGGTKVHFLKPASWVRDNLAEGWLEIHFYADLNENHIAALRRLAVTPAGGRVSP